MQLARVLVVKGGRSTGLFAWAKRGALARSALPADLNRPKAREALAMVHPRSHPCPLQLDVAADDLMASIHSQLQQARRKYQARSAARAQQLRARLLLWLCSALPPPSNQAPSEASVCRQLRRSGVKLLRGFPGQRGPAPAAARRVRCLRSCWKGRCGGCRLPAG